MIQELLSTGAENAVTLRELTALLKMDGRSVRLAISAERLAGAPILSDNRHGYFLPASDWDRVRFVRSMRGRAREIDRVADALAGHEAAGIGGESGAEHGAE